jgi:type II secretory pathway pseudopilin PulG
VFADPRAGTTLVEVLISSLILAVLAVGTAGYLFHARAEVGQETDRRLAMEVANTRMEELRMADYHAFKPPADNFGAYYLAKQGTGWDHSAADPGETVMIDDRSFSIVSTVRYLDVDGGLPSYDYVAVTVQSVYGPDPVEHVTLETYAYAP